MKATAVAPANIAFIKYWGKRDEALRLPLNSSISMNLSGAFSTTTVEFSSQLLRDEVEFLDESTSHNEIDRIIRHLDQIRNTSGNHLYARVVTGNSFPKGTGAAASASGFAALTVAGFAAAGVTLSEKKLTIFARMGSGSACRSIPDGFVLWERGETSDESYAYSLFPHAHWDMCDVLVIVDFKMKKVSTTEGQKGVMTSRLWKDRIEGIPKKIIQVKKALKEKNFTTLGELIEEDCLSMHHVMQTQDPPIHYWNETTVALMDAVKHWRREGIPVYFTIDAGPNVHLICEAKDVAQVKRKVQEVSGVQKILINEVASGTRIVNTHLF